MIRRRRRDAGHFGNHANPEVLIVIFLIGIMAAILIPMVMNLRPSLGKLCVEQLAGSLGQGPVTGSSCPACCRPYLVLAEGDAEVLGCPAPERHLDTRPEFVRRKGGAWSLRQTLPPASGKPPEFVDWTTEVAESPGRLSLHLVPEGSTRYFWGPIGLLVLGGPALLLFGAFVKRMFQGDRDGRLACLVFSVLLGTPACFVLLNFASSTEIILEQAGARVRVVRYRFGVPWSEKLYQGCLGFIPAPAAAGRGPKLLLVHPPDAEGARVTELAPLSSDRFDSVRRFNGVLTGC